VDDLRQRVQIIRDHLSGIITFPRVFSLEGINPLVIGGHWIPDLLQKGGGDQKLYPPGSPARRLEWQEIVNYAPEKLFIDLCSSNLERHQREIPWLFDQPGWWDIPAVKSGEVYLIDHVYFSRPGPRIVTGLEIIAELTHPSLFSGMVPPSTVMKFNPDVTLSLSGTNITSTFHPY